MAPSGRYWIDRGESGNKPVIAYCDMERGGRCPGFTRLEYSIRINSFIINLSFFRAQWSWSVQEIHVKMVELVTIRGRASIHVSVHEGTTGATVNLVSNASIDGLFSKQLFFRLQSFCRKLLVVFLCYIFPTWHISVDSVLVFLWDVFSCLNLLSPCNLMYFDPPVLLEVLCNLIEWKKGEHVSHPNLFLEQGNTNQLLRHNWLPERGNSCPLGTSPRVRQEQLPRKP